MPIYKKRAFKNRILEVTPRDIYVECRFYNCAIHGYGSTFRHCIMEIPDAASAEMVDGDGIYVMSEGNNHFDDCQYVTEPEK